MFNMIFYIIVWLVPLIYDYQRTFLPELIEESKIIAHIEIVEVKDKTVKALIKSKIKGEINQNTISYSKFENWTCAYRYDEYKIGQNVLVFLYQDETGWGLIGAGNEGEMQIEYDNLIYDPYLSFAGILDPPYKTNNPNIMETKLKYNLDLAIQGIQKYLDSLKNIKRIKEMDDLNKITGQNDFLKRLIKERVLIFKDDYDSKFRNIILEERY